MSTNQLLLALCVGVPLFGSVLLPFIGRASESARNWAALLMVLTSLFTAAGLVPLVMSGATETLSLAGFNALHADKLAVFMALCSTLVGSIIVFYSWGYIDHAENKGEYYFMVVVFLGAMMGLVFSRNLLLMYLFWEITAIACWRLIGFFREKTYVWRADKAFLITGFGALCMLVGFVVLRSQTGSFDMGVIQQKLGAGTASDLAVGMILLGILSKSATLPLHTWLPDAGVAPSPVTALLHAAVLVKIGVYAFARILVATVNLEAIWYDVIPWVAAISALVSAGAALIDTDLKRIIAYSTVSQIAFIFLGLSVGDVQLAVGGGLLYILMHGIAKGGLFLCAGIIEHQTHNKDITRMGGLGKTMPITAASFLLCAFSVMGIPPFGGFFSKYMVMAGAVSAGQTTVALVFLFGAFLTILYLFRVYTMVFLGPPRGEHHAVEGSKTMVASVAMLAGLALVSGLLFKYPSEMVESTVKDIVKYERLAR